MHISTAIALAMLQLMLLASPATSAGGEDNRLGKWVQLDNILQTRMFTKLQQDYDAKMGATEDAQDPLFISVAWAYVRREVCLKGATTFLVNMKSLARCDNAAEALKAGRRACKVAGIKPGDVLLGNCSLAFSRSCSAFFSVPGQAISPLCDAVGMTRMTPPSRKEDLHYDLGSRTYHATSDQSQMTSLRELFSRRFFGSSGHASDVAAPSDCTIRPPPPDEVGIDGAGAACEPSPPAAAEATGTPTTASDASPSRKHRRLDGGCSPSASTQVAPHPPPIEMQQTKACVHSDVLWRAPRRSSSETLCYIYAHIWFRMARTHQQASSTYVVLDPEAWQHAVHSTARSAPEAFPATLVFGIGGGSGSALGGSARGRRYHGTASVEVRDDAIQTLLQVATSDDDDRWVPGLVSAPGRRANNSVCRSDDFATSMDAVFALILRLYSAHDVLDASTWLVALVLAERLYVRHQQHMATGVDHNTAFRLYRRHELRHLFTLFNLTVKLTSDYCFHLRFLHNHLPSLITRMPLARTSAACTHMATRSLLPAYLRAKYPLIAQRVDQSAQAEYAGAAGGLSRLPTSPPFCLRSAANAEGSMLRFGLGYHGLVLWGDATQLMDAYCSEGERRTLEDALQAARGQH